MTIDEAEYKNLVTENAKLKERLIKNKYELIENKYELRECRNKFNQLRYGAINNGGYDILSNSFTSKRKSS